MCGIFGVDYGQTKFSKKSRLVLTTLLAAFNDSRGGMSWGMCSLKENEYFIRKGLGDITEHIPLLYKQSNFFAHTRFATHGDILVRNAHPFLVGNIIGAHNGVLSNHERLNFEYNREFEVDSQHIFAHIDEGRSLEDLEGYGSIEWVKADNPRRICLCKLDNGDLAVAKATDKNGNVATIWSSSKEHLTTALTATKWQWVMYEIEYDVVYHSVNGQLYKTKDKLEISPPVVKHDWKRGKWLGTYTTGEYESCVIDPKGEKKDFTSYNISGKFTENDDYLDYGGIYDYYDRRFEEIEAGNAAIQKRTEVLATLKKS